MAKSAFPLLQLDQHSVQRVLAMSMRRHGGHLPTNCDFKYAHRALIGDICRLSGCTACAKDRDQSCRVDLGVYRPWSTGPVVRVISAEI